MKHLFDKLKGNKKLTISIILILSLTILCTGISFTVFNYTNNNAGNNGINSGHISMAYTEPSNEYIVENAFPMKDQEGITSTNYFEFSVTTTAPTKDVDNEGVSIPYEITITESEGNTLTNDKIKMYLTEVKGEKENLHTKPTLVSNFEPSLYKDEGIKVGFNLHLHRNGNKTITTKYRLRAWINYDVDASDWNTSNKYQYKFRVNINGTTQYQGYHTDLSCFALEETKFGDYIINGYDFTKCDSKNIVVPFQTDEKHTIQYKKVLAVHWATEQEAIEAYKKYMISDGFCSDYGDIVSDEDWKGCLAHNGVTEEEFNQEAKEINDYVKVDMSYINDWVGNNYYEHTAALDEEQLENLNLFISLGFISIETSEETEISTYKKVVKINSMSNTSVAAVSNNNDNINLASNLNNIVQQKDNIRAMATGTYEVELLIIPEAIPIAYGAFSEINIKELFDKSGIFPSSCFEYSIENEKVSVDDFLCEGVKKIIIHPKLTVFLLRK